MHARWLSCQNEPWFKQQANMHVWVQLAQATSSTHEQSMLRASESHTNSWGWAPGWLLRRLRLRLGRTVPLLLLLSVPAACAALAALLLLLSAPAASVALAA